MTERISIQEYKAMTGKKNYRALGRLKSGEMNNTENKYAASLEARKQCGEIIGWWFDCVNFRLGENCHYRPDFMVMLNTGEIEFHETKGFWTDDAKVKIKVAADKFPFRFVAIQWIKKEWVVTEF